MDIMELGAVGELVGGVAVIASLIYVGIQVRQSNVQARNDAAREVATHFDRYLETILVDPAVRDLWIQATGGVEAAPMKNPLQLSPEEHITFSVLLYRGFTSFHSHYRAWKDGTLDEEQWAKIRPFIRYHLRKESARDWWLWAGDGWFDPEFTEFIDSEIRSLDSDKPWARV